jgi:peptidoglycan/LPS O-acetylase OafA/YrhL
MKRIPQLDAVRGIAVLLVLVHNTDIYPQLHLGWIADNGWMGVDLFFVLSGFLITGILLDTKKSQSYFSNFYIRRCLRIWPLYYSSLLFMFLIVPFLRPTEAHSIFDPRSSPWWAYPLFLQNYLVPVPIGARGLLGVTWSLAVEEHFYLIWPFVVRFCNQNQLRKIAIIVILASPLLRLFLSQYGVQIYSNPVCRLDGLMAGALLALILRSEEFVPSKYLALAWIALLSSAPLALYFDIYFHARWIVFSFVALGSFCFIYLALFSRLPVIQKVLGNRFLVYSGVISYGIYMLEKIPIDFVKTTHFGAASAWAYPVTIAATYLIATLSWRLLEAPFLRLKRYFVTSSHSETHVRAEAVL